MKYCFLVSKSESTEIYQNLLRYFTIYRLVYLQKVYHIFHFFHVPISVYYVKKGFSFMTAFVYPSISCVLNISVNLTLSCVVRKRFLLCHLHIIFPSRGECPLHKNSIIFARIFYAWNTYSNIKYQINMYYMYMYLNMYMVLIIFNIDPSFDGL